MDTKHWEKIILVTLHSWMMSDNQIQDNHWPNLKINILLTIIELLEFFLLQPYNQIYINPVVIIFISIDKSWSILIMITFENDNRSEWTKIAWKWSYTPNSNILQMSLL